MTDHLEAELLQGLPHGFSTRHEPDLEAILPGAPLVRVRQVHGADVAAAGDALADTIDADALVTDRPGLLLGIVTADCAPVLFADPVARIIGAAHAGWRGAHAGVLENTVEAMVVLGAQRDDIRAVIGPTIAQASYEVDGSFRGDFGSGDERFFAPGREGRWQFDLPAYVQHRLESAGVGAVEDLHEDTYSQPDRFHSYRRATHLSEKTEGRQLSVIALPS